MSIALLSSGLCCGTAVILVSAPLIVWLHELQRALWSVMAARGYIATPSITGARAGIVPVEVLAARACIDVSIRWLYRALCLVLQR